MDLDLTGGAPFGPLVDRAVTRFEPRAVAVPSTGPVGALTRDAWAAALLFCDGRTAVRVRGVASVLRDAVDLACRLGLARPRQNRPGGPRVPPPHPPGPPVAGARGDRASSRSCSGPPRTATRAQDSWALCQAAANGHATVLDRLAKPPSLGQEDARARDNWALCQAAANGHAAVLVRLALPPYSPEHHHRWQR